VGGTGTGVGSVWFSWGSRRSAAMATDGESISIFAQVSDHRTASSGTHQGDLFIRVDGNGNLDESSRDFWSASHSTLPHLVLGPDGEGLRLTVGDSNPYGLEYQTAAQYGDVVVWPPEAQREAGRAGADSSVSAGDLCGLQYRDGRLYATAASGRTQPFSPRNDFADVVLLSWDAGIEEGDNVEVTWLSDTPSLSELCPTLTELGDDHQVSVWGARDGTTATLALLDGQGGLVSGPTDSTAPFNKSSMAVALAGGDVAWTYAEANTRTVQVAVVRAD